MCYWLAISKNTHTDASITNQDMNQSETIVRRVKSYFVIRSVDVLEKSFQARYWLSLQNLAADASLA